jgi:2'-5' RNA ligase
MEKESIYFIGIIPPGEICDSITAFRMDFADRFKSRAALRIVPHITLKAPFKLTSDQPEIKRWFQAISFQQGAFQIELKDFGVFNKKRNPVVFVSPVLNTQLSTLQEEIIRSFRLTYPEIAVTGHELKFHPHITIAYRDLGLANFTEAWKEYEKKEYRAIFNVDGIVLLQHDGRGWNVIDKRILKNAPEIL